MEQLPKSASTTLERLAVWLFVLPCRKLRARFLRVLRLAFCEGHVAAQDAEISRGSDISSNVNSVRGNTRRGDILRDCRGNKLFRLTMRGNAKAKIRVKIDEEGIEADLPTVIQSGGCQGATRIDQPGSNFGGEITIEDGKFHEGNEAIISQLNEHYSADLSDGVDADIILERHIRPRQQSPAVIPLSPTSRSFSWILL